MSSTPPPQEEDSFRPAESRPPLEVLLAGVVSALFLAAFQVLPFPAPLCFPFAAVPVVRVTHRRGIGAGVASSALAVGLLFVVGWSVGNAAEAAQGAIFASALTALPAFFASAVRRGGDPSRAYLGLCGAGLALAGCLVLARPAATDAAMAREINHGFDEWLRLSSQPGQPSVDSDTAARIRVTLEAARDFCKRFWFGLIGVTWVLAAATGFYTGARLARPAPSAERIHFEALSVPPAIVPFFVATGAGWALAPAPIGRVAGNLLWPVAALYFVAGLSIICHFARKWFRARILRVGLYALVIYVPINVGVILLGLFDWYADFRRRGKEIKAS